MFLAYLRYKCNLFLMGLIYVVSLKNLVTLCFDTNGSRCLCSSGINFCLSQTAVQMAFRLPISVICMCLFDITERRVPLCEGVEEPGSSHLETIRPVILNGMTYLIEKHIPVDYHLVVLVIKINFENTCISLNVSTRNFLFYRLL